MTAALRAPLWAVTRIPPDMHGATADTVAQDRHELEQGARMFRPEPRQLTMNDPERGYRWRDVGTREKGEVLIAVLTLAGIEIPYEYRVEEVRDGDTRWYDLEIGAFGVSVVGQIQNGLIPHDWTTRSERESAVLIAIEATIAWFPGGQGLLRGDGYMRSTFQGRTYRLSDFGAYYSSS